MVTLNISLPDTVNAFVQSQVAGGEYADAGEYLSKLVQRDQQGRDALLAALIEGEESGESPYTMEEIMQRAEARLKHG